MDELDAQTVQALEELTRVCLGMDLERQDDRPTEEEYLAAVAQAEEALRGHGVDLRKKG
jgi:hypothetical protein